MHQNGKEYTFLSSVPSLLMKNGFFIDWVFFFSFSSTDSYLSDPVNGYFGLVWFGLVSFSSNWFSLVWFSVVWFGLVCFGLVWYGLVWFGLTWFSFV